MRFDHEKWRRLQDKKAALHQVYSGARDEFDHAHQAFARSRLIFLSNYREAIVAHDTIARDYKLAAADIDIKIKLLKHDWPKACEEFNVKEAWLGRNALIELYEQMRDLARCRENKEQAAANQNAFGACFRVLDNFAAKYGANDKSRSSAVNDAMPSHGETFNMPLA